MGCRANSTKARRRTPKKYCSKRWKQEGWILAQAARILFKLDRSEWWEIIQKIARVGTEWQQ